VVYISSDDGSPPAKKRAAAPRPEKGKVKVPASKPDGNHPSISSGYVNSEDLLAATKQLELLRSWVDAGIEIAIREMVGNQRYGSHLFEIHSANLQLANRHRVSLSLRDLTTHLPCRA
jgi:hypothetical protein